MEKCPKNWKLKISFDEQDKLWIRGDKKGLEFLADCCLRIIGKTDPSNHIHLEWQMNNLCEGSIETILEFSNSSEDYKNSRKG